MFRRLHAETSETVDVRGTMTEDAIANFIQTIIAATYLVILYIMYRTLIASQKASSKQLSVMVKSLTTSQEANSEQIENLQKQLKTTQEASLTQGYLAFLSFIHRDEVREARHLLIDIIGKSDKHGDFNEWTESEKDTADKACSQYDLVAHMIKNDIGGERIRKLVIEDWAGSIDACHEAAKPLLKAYRLNRGKAFWQDFTWLAEKAKVELAKKARNES